jgi:hypothetical protein
LHHLSVHLLRSPCNSGCNSWLQWVHDVVVQGAHMEQA